MNKMPKFSNFLLFESKAYLAEKIGTLLSSLESLHSDSEGLGKRALERALNRIVDKIRNVLHGHWEDTDKQDLLVLQKVAVGIMTGMEESDANLPELVASAVEELSKLTGDLEEPLNNLASEFSAVDSERQSGVNSDQNESLPNELEAS